MTESIIVPSRRSKLIRALRIGFLLAFAALAVALLAFISSSVILGTIADALSPGSTVAGWLAGVPNDPYGAGGMLLVGTEFLANWIFYAGLVFVTNLLIELFRPNTGCAHRASAGAESPTLTDRIRDDND